MQNLLVFCLKSYSTVGAVLVPAREIMCKAGRAHTRGAPTLKFLLCSLTYVSGNG